VVAAGVKPDKGEWETLEGRVRDLYFAGDTRDPHGGILEAITEGNRAGRSL